MRLLIFLVDTEQLSIDIRYNLFERENPVIKEEFLGFVVLTDMYAKSVVKSIITFSGNSGLNLNNLVGRGYYGCNAMSDIHMLSPKRRKIIEKLPLFCETRWSEEYKTIRIVTKHFVNIVGQLELISMEPAVDSQTKSQAFQLHSTATTSNCIVFLIIMATFSAQLEPITNALQAVQLDFSQAKKNIETIEVFNNMDAKNYFYDIFKKAQNVANELGEKIKISHIVSNQKHYSNHPINTPILDYFRCRVSSYQRYVDSLIM
ncbi:hypothetical protein QTP88_001471 [Uroleucon formosanum]